MLRTLSLAALLGVSLATLTGCGAGGGVASKAKSDPTTAVEQETGVAPSRYAAAERTMSDYSTAKKTASPSAMLKGKPPAKLPN